MLLKIPQGQVTVDAKRGQVFLITGNEAMDLSAFGSGMNRFFTDHLAFEILRYFPTVNVDNHFNGLGLHGVYDSKYDRIIITKLDYTPKSNNIKYDSVTQEFYIENTYPQQNTTTSTSSSSTSTSSSSSTTSTSSSSTSSTTTLAPGTTTSTTTLKPLITREVVYLTDEAYFCNRSWTLSFNFNTKSWISFHSYIPNWYIAENNFFYSGQNDCCTTLDALVGTPTAPTTTTTTTAFSCTCRTYQVSNFTGFTQQYDYYDCNNVLRPAVTILSGQTQQVCVCNDRIQYADRALIVTLISGTCITTTTSTTTTAYTGCNLAGVACEQTTTTTTSSSTSTTTTSSTSTTTTSSTSTSTTSTTTTAFGTNCTFYQIQPIESISIEWEDCGTGTPLSGTYVSTHNICANTGTLNVTGGTGVITIVGPC